MADNNQAILEILIRMGLDDAAAKDAVRQIEGIKGSTSGLSAETAKATEASGGFTRKGYEMRIMAAELNRVLPGLGLAFRGLTSAMGPFIVVALAIQAAVTLWKFYKDEVALAAKAHTDAMDKMRKSTHDAVEELSKFKTAMAEGESATQRDTAALAEGEAILEAQIKARGELRKALGLKPESEVADQQAKLALINNTMATVSAQLKPLVEQQDALEAKMRTGREAPASLAEDTKLFAERGKKIADLQKYYAELEQRGRTTANVLAVQGPAEHATAIAKAGGGEAFVTGVAGAEQTFLAGKKLTDQQKDFLALFGDWARDHGATLDQITAALHVLVASTAARKAETTNINATLQSMATGGGSR